MPTGALSIHPLSRPEAGTRDLPASLQEANLVSPPNPVRRLLHSLALAYLRPAALEFLKRLSSFRALGAYGSPLPRTRQSKQHSLREILRGSIRVPRVHAPQP